MASANALLKYRISQENSQVAEPDVRIGSAVQDLQQQSSVHTCGMPHRRELASLSAPRSVAISPSKSAREPDSPGPPWRARRGASIVHRASTSYSVRMLVLAVLLIGWLIFRAAGAAGVERLANWRDSGRWALAVMLIFTASAHFTSMRHDLARMVPVWMPNPDAVILVTGILEVSGAIGLLLPATRALAGVCLCLLFVAMFTANVKAAREGLTIGGTPATGLLLRLPMQVLFIWLAWWSTRGREGSDRLRRHRGRPLA